MRTPPEQNSATSISPDAVELWRALFVAANNTDIATRVQKLLAGLDAQVAARGPVCWSSGKCCNFDAYGHRLYVTGLEIAWMLTEISDGAAKSSAMALPEKIDLKGSCPFQVNLLCSTHTIRPMGCRIFFCQKGTEKWQHELYETYLTQLRQLHSELGLPYRYLEWRAGLDEALRVKKLGARV